MKNHLRPRVGEVDDRLLHLTQRARGYGEEAVEEDGVLAGLGHDVPAWRSLPVRNSRDEVVGELVAD